MGAICFCNSNIPWGGGEAWHLGAARALGRRGRRVLLLCREDGELYRRATGDPELASLPNVRILPCALGRLSFLNPWTRKRLAALFRQEEVDALIMNLPSDLKAAGPAAQDAGVRHIVYRRGSALPVKNSRLNRKLYGTVLTRLIVNSQATRDMALSANAELIPEERITILFNGLDIADFDKRFAAVREPTLVWPGGRRPAFVIGNAGRLHRQKGQHMLLRLAALLKEAGLDFGLVIAGTGPLEAELKAKAAELGVADRVLFAGFMEDLSAFWRETDLFVLSSLWEGFGYVLLEAMLARLPVFAFGVSNIPELIRDGENGRLFALPEEEKAFCPDYTGRKETDRETGGAAPYAPLRDMAEAVCALAADPDARARMGEAGRSFALGFSQEASMDALEALLQ